MAHSRNTSSTLAGAHPLFLLTGRELGGQSHHSSLKCLSPSCPTTTESHALQRSSVLLSFITKPSHVLMPVLTQEWTNATCVPGYVQFTFRRKDPCKPWKQSWGHWAGNCRTLGPWSDLEEGHSSEKAKHVLLALQTPPWGEGLNWRRPKVGLLKHRAQGRASLARV